VDGLLTYLMVLSSTFYGAVLVPFMVPQGYLYGSLCVLLWVFFEKVQ
jgi:hypothetical protein